MNRKLFFVCILFNLCSLIGQSSQNNSTISGSCIYGIINNDINVCKELQRSTSSFDANSDAYKTIENILKPLGIKPNFIAIPCDNITSCAAIIWSDGLRYIIFNSTFLNSISVNTNTNWTNLAIFAHEMGHHLLEHELSKMNLSKIKADELEADEFSGLLLAKMGATLTQAQIVAKQSGEPNCVEEIHYPHPCPEKRLAAIAKGWKSGKEENGSMTKSTEWPANIPMDYKPAEIDYLYSIGYIEGYHWFKNFPSLYKIYTPSQGENIDLSSEYHKSAGGEIFNYATFIWDGKNYYKVYKGDEFIKLY